MDAELLPRRTPSPPSAAGAQTIWPLGESTSSGQSMQQQILAIAGVRWPYPPG